MFRSGLLSWNIDGIEYQRLPEETARNCCFSGKLRIFSKSSFFQEFIVSSRNFFFNFHGLRRSFYLKKIFVVEKDWQHPEETARMNSDFYENGQKRWRQILTLKWLLKESYLRQCDMSIGDLLKKRR